MTIAAGQTLRHHLQILRAAALTAVLLGAPLVAAADPHAVDSMTRAAAKVSVADLNLSTPEGLRQARVRLHETARRLCARVADFQDASHQSNFVACVDETWAAALRQLSGTPLASASVPQSPRP